MRIATIERIAKNIATALTGSAAFEAATDLRTRLFAAIERSRALTEFVATDGSPDSLLDETGAPCIVLEYRKVISPHYASELSFTLNQGTLRAFVRTLHLKDGRGAKSQNFVVAGNGEYEEEVKFYSVEGLAKQAVQRCLEHRVSLLQDLGFSVSRLTLKKLVKSAGSLSF
jgi:hypothetical protein